MKENFDYRKNWGNILPERMEAVLEFSGIDILDAGCARGDYVKFLNSKKYKAKGCDVCRYSEWDNNFLVGDIENLPFEDGSFDTILAFEVIEHLKNPDIAIKELYRVCRKNVIVSVPNCYKYEILINSGLNFNHYIDRSHVNFFTEESLAKIFKENGFKIKKLSLINPIIPENIILDMLNIPQRMAEIIKKNLVKLSFRKKYYMTILIVANK